VQDALRDPDDTLLKSVTGLEGGCVANGSTCGIASGGALGIALKFEPYLQQGDPQMEAVAINAAGQYLDWFRATHGTTQCWERNHVDFLKITGQLRYFLSARKILRCIKMAGRSIQYLTSENHDGTFMNPVSTELKQSCSPLHCAQEVLQQVHSKTNIGNNRLERLSIVLDGGIGLRGALCGALAGAILSLNLVHGFNLRQMSYGTVIKKFLIGHINLIREKPGRHQDTFSIGKKLVTRFREQAGSIECSIITSRQFQNMDDFNRHMENSDTCKNLIHASAELATEAIQQTSI
jgi:C_GCAxxG_C_C family probable redox protein